VDYWESYGTNHETSLNEYSNTELFYAKGKFLFHDKVWKFTGKSKFNNENKKGEDIQLEVNSEYALKNSCPKGTTEIKHKQNSLEVESNCSIYDKEKVGVKLFTNFVLEQDKAKRQAPGKIHVRVHHDDDKILSLGVENYDIFNNWTPDTLSGWFLYGKSLDKGTKQVFGGVQTAFKLSSKDFLYNKVLLGFKTKELKSFLEFGFLNEKKQMENEEKGKLTTVVHKVVDLKVDYEVNEKLKVGGDINLNIDTMLPDIKLYKKFLIEKGTTVKVRLDNFETLIMGLSHTFGKIDVSMTARLKHIKPKFEEKNHFKSKFGFNIEFNDELI